MKKFLMDEYSDETFNELESQAENILKFIDESQTELQKFLSVYLMLGLSVFYDKYWDYNGKIRPAQWDGNQDLERSIIRRS